MSNDDSCREDYLLKKALNDLNYRQVLIYLVKKNMSWCKNQFSICLFLESSILRYYSQPEEAFAVVRPDENVNTENKDQLFSYLPFGKYHFEGLRKGEVICHKNFPNVNHTPFVFLIESKGETFKNYTVTLNWRSGCLEVLFHEAIEEFDIVFAKSSYGRGFPYTGAYGPLNMALKM